MGSTVMGSRGCSKRFFSVFFGNGSHFRAESQDDSHIDVIGYKRRTSDVVVGDKFWTVMLKCERHKCFWTKTCSFFRTKYLNNRWNRFSNDFMKNMISMLW